MMGIHPSDRTRVARERLPERPHPRPRASVVVVVYNTPPGILRENLRALERQTVEDFETIVIDNSDRRGSEVIACAHALHYLKLRENYGLSLARNVGIRMARGAIVIFLDDDAIPARDFVEQHLRAHERPGTIGVRGKALPRTRTIYNQLTNQYDLGPGILPYLINLEGNSSFKRDILLELGGFREDLKNAGGHEGAELSIRIVRHFGGREGLIYYPGALIRHDFCGSFAKYVSKLKRHAGHRNILQEDYPGLSAFFASYPPPDIGGADRKRSRLTVFRLWLICKGASLFLRLDRVRRRRV